jgi:ABC-type microcin C transport system permease subunit YejB
MSFASTKKGKQIIAGAAVCTVLFVIGCITLPLLSEKILLGIILLLIAGVLFFTNDTGRYVCKRVLLALVTVFIIAAITFFAMNAIPGGPFSKEKAPSAAVQAVLEERFHLNEPVGKQFLMYLEGLMQGVVGSGLAVLLLVVMMDSLTEALPMVAAYMTGYGLLLVLVVLMVSMLSAYFSFRTVRSFLIATRNEQVK